MVPASNSAIGCDKPSGTILDLEKYFLNLANSHQHLYPFEQYHLLLDNHQLISLLSHAILSLTDFHLILHNKSMLLSLSHLITSFFPSHSAIMPYNVESTNAPLLTEQNSFLYLGGTQFHDCTI